MKKLLSREPTPEMVEAADMYQPYADKIYKAMWDAAPELPEAGEVEDSLRITSEELKHLPSLKELFIKAADLIKAQRAEVAALREALDKAARTLRGEGAEDQGDAYDKAQRTINAALKGEQK